MSDFDFLKSEIEDSFISADNLKHSSTGDGRLDSAESEIVVVEHLKELFADSVVTIKVAPRPRYWYDVLLELNGKSYPVNVKITSGAQADNVSSKEGLFYTLTGMWPEKVSGLNRWNSYNTLLTENLNFNTDGDYYFVVYFKEEGTFLFTSLKHIDTLVANGNNLPFQCKWGNNYEFTSRTTEEQCQYLMDIYFDSWIKKVGGFEPLMNWKTRNSK